MASAETPLDSFFASHSPFDYDPQASATAEFARMCEFFNWGQARSNRERKAFKRAMALCEAIDMETIPDTLKGCKAAVKSAYVNLVDLLDAARNGEHARRYPNEKALSRYTKQTGKFFPRDAAKAGGLLRFLLRCILRPSNRA